MADPVDKVLADLDEQIGPAEDMASGSPGSSAKRLSISQRRSTVGSFSSSLSSALPPMGTGLDMDVLEIVSPSDTGEDTFGNRDSMDSLEDDFVEDANLSAPRSRSAVLRSEDFEGEDMMVEHFEDISLDTSFSKTVTGEQDKSRPGSSGFFDRFLPRPSSRNSLSEGSPNTQRRNLFSFQKRAPLNSAGSSRTSLAAERDPQQKHSLQDFTDLNLNLNPVSSGVDSTFNVQETQRYPSHAADVNESEMDPVTAESPQIPFVNIGVNSVHSPFDIQEVDGFAPSHDVSAPHMSQKSKVVQLEKVVSMTRQRTLPPKDPREEQKHLREHQKMMKSAMEKEKRRELREIKRLEERERFFNMAISILETKIIPEWEKRRNERRTIQLWRYGLPPKVRGRIWRLAVGNPLGISEQVYRDSLNTAKEVLRLRNDLRMTSHTQDDSARVSSPSQHSKENTIDIIKYDVFRTFPSMGLFQEGSPFHQDLSDVLEAYVIYQPDIGYVQGMSFIVAILLINNSAYEAFVIFATILRRPLHRAFFQMELSGMKPYFGVFCSLVSEKLPSIDKHFRLHKIESDLFLVDWFMSIYTRSLPLDISSRILDWYLVRGEVFLFQVGIALLKYFESRLLRQNADGLLYELTHLPHNIDEDRLFKIMDSVPISTNHYNELFQKHSKETLK